jgi:hypothetical protein
MKNTSVILIIFLIHFGVKAQWQQVGSTYLTSSITSNWALIEDDAGNLYSAFQPFTDNFLYVKKYELGSWNQVGASASTEPISQADMSIGADGLPVVVYRNYNDSLVVRKFNGTLWETIGTGPFAKGDYPRIKINSANTIHVVFNNKAVFPWGTSVYKFEGGIWGPLHAQYVENLQSEFTDLAFDSNDRAVVSFRRASTGKMSVYKSDGNTWQAAGNTQFSPNNVFYGRLTLDNNDVPFVSFTDQSVNHRGSVMFLNGVTWEFLGSPNFTGEWVDYSSIVFDDSNVPFAVYNDGFTRLMSYNGTSWVQVSASAGNGNDHHLILNQYGNPVVSYTNINQNYNLIVKQLCTPISVNQDVTLCFGEIYEIDGQIFDEVGTYQVNLLSASGCDSIVNLNVTVLPLNNFNQSATICAGDIFAVGTTQYDQSGVFTTYLQSIDGCDSMVITDLTVLAPIETQQSVEICSGESFQVGTTVYTVSGTYNEILQSVQGCDSLVITDLIVQAPIETQQSVEICSGESFQVGTAVYTSSGTYNEIIQSIEGCDSTVTTVLTVKEPIDLSLDLTGNVLTSNQNGAQYQWIDCSTMNDLIGEIDQSFSVIESGEYIVEITLDGCTATSDCQPVAVIGLNELNLDFLISPNPADNSIKVSGSQFDEITVMDLSGRKLIVQKMYNQYDTEIDLIEIEAGKYIVELKNKDTIIGRSIFIKF